MELAPGPNRFVIPVPLRVAGAHRFRAQFVPDRAEADTIEDNNTGEAFTVVSGQGKILILTTSQDLASEQPSAEILRHALEAEKLVCDVEVAGQNPLDQVRLLEYSLVMLSNVPAGDLRDEEKKALAVYVRDLGGGLVMVGGDDSFGAGGWLGSPVEEVMPVSFDVKHKKQFLKGALVLVMHACEIAQGNYLGERCAIEAVKTLSSRDLVGVLAWQWLGDKQGHWVVPLQEVGVAHADHQRDQQDEHGRPAGPGRGDAAGVEALMARKDVGPKHMIVMSDFDPAPPRGRPDRVDEGRTASRAPRSRSAMAAIRSTSQRPAGDRRRRPEAGFTAPTTTASCRRSSSRSRARFGGRWCRRRRSRRGW